MWRRLWGFAKQSMALHLNPDTTSSEVFNSSVATFNRASVSCLCRYQLDVLSRDSCQRYSITPHNLSSKSHNRST